MGIAYPPHYRWDTLDRVHRRYSTWASHRLGHVATRLIVANGVKHQALSDAYFVKEIVLAMLKEIPTVNTIADVMCVSQPLTFANAPVCAIEPPAGFEALSTAITEQCTITMVYESGWQRSGPRKITPCLVLEVQGVVYVIAHCHLSDAERTFRLDRIRVCGLDEEGQQS